MEKNVISDGTYKFIYKLPSNCVLESDFSLKKDENFESILYENFEQEKIPKILLNDINILMKHFLYEERKHKKTYTNEQRENLKNKNFIQKIINDWNGIKTFQNHLERKIFY
jgi:hypothetical protein